MRSARPAYLVRLIYSASLLADRRGSKSLPTALEVVEAYRRAGARPPAVVALAGPREPHAAGKIGCYSDGRQHAAVVMLFGVGAPAPLRGARTNGVVRSNVIEYVYGDRD